MEMVAKPVSMTIVAATRADAAAIGHDYLARAAHHRRATAGRFVDKFPGNFLHVGLIHLMLPNARIIDVRRDPRGCCLSLFKQACTMPSSGSMLQCPHRLP